MIDDDLFRAAVEGPDVPDDEIEDMTDEQLTLWLARQGISPEDSRRGMERAMARFRTKLAEVRADAAAEEAMINEGGR